MIRMAYFELVYENNQFHQSLGTDNVCLLYNVYFRLPLSNIPLILYNFKDFMNHINDYKQASLACHAKGTEHYNMLSSILWYNIILNTNQFKVKLP